MQRILHNTIAAAALTLTAAFAGAQTPPPPAPLQAPMAASGASDTSPHAMRHHGQKGEWQQHRAERMQKHLDALKTRLAITPEQEGAWTTFTAALKPDASAQDGVQKPHMDRAAWMKLTTPERIDQMHAMRARRFAMADARGDATKTFYAALTPAQQKTFDEQASRMMMKKHHGDRHHHERHQDEAR